MALLLFMRYLRVQAKSGLWWVESWVKVNDQGQLAASVTFLVNDQVVAVLPAYQHTFEEWIRTVPARSVVGIDEEKFNTVYHLYSMS